MYAASSTDAKYDGASANLQSRPSFKITCRSRPGAKKRSKTPGVDNSLSDARILDLDHPSRRGFASG
jgi:hypothetical protein